MAQSRTKTDAIQIITAMPSAASARKISRVLVQKRLAACVQVTGPVTSIYRWENRVETAREWLCLIKTGKALYGWVEKEIRKMHPYEVPEILAVPISRGDRRYLRWLSGEIGDT